MLKTVAQRAIRTNKLLQPKPHYTHTETKHLFSTCVQGKILVIRFDLTRLQASTVHRLCDRSEQNFFVISHRFKTRDNLWDARDNPKVEITVKDNFLHIQRRALFPTRTLTGVGEVLLLKGGDPIDITDNSIPDIGIRGNKFLL